MPLLRFLIALGCTLAVTSAVMLQTGHRNAALDLCPWVREFSSPCPPWMLDQTLPEMVPWMLYALAAVGALFVLAPLARSSLDEPPESALARFIQRGRDLHERCRKEGEQAVLPDIKDWIADVNRYLRHLGHRYVVSFSDFRNLELFASQYDTAATLEIRQRLHRLNEFAQRFRSGDAAPE